MYENSRVYTTTSQQHYVTPSVYINSLPDINLKLDLDYFKTLPGLLKLIAVILDFLCFVCVIIGGPGTYAGVGWATFVSVFGFVFSLTLLILYLFHIVDQFSQIPWIVGEMSYCFVWTIFYFITGSILAIASVNYPLAGGWAVAAFFAFLALLTYALDSYLKFLSWKNNEKAVGGYGNTLSNQNSQPTHF